MSRKTKAELETENAELKEKIFELRAILDNLHREVKALKQSKKAGVNAIHGDTGIKKEIVCSQYRHYRAQGLGKNRSRDLANADIIQRYGEGYSDRHLIRMLKK